MSVGKAPRRRFRPDCVNSACVQQANEIRLAPAKLKKELASGKLELAQILAEPPECVRTARLHELLLVFPKIGPSRADRILAQWGIAHSKTIAGRGRGRTPTGSAR